MSANRAKQLGCLYLCFFLLMGCATSRAPEGWLPKPEKALSEAFGAWMIVKYHSAVGLMMSQGEFIGVKEKKAYLLGRRGLVDISVDNVDRLTLEIYKGERVVGTWAGLGTLSTLSHGWFLFISAPIWIITGIFNAAAESTGGMMKSSEIDWQSLKIYARFPQGIPKDLNLSLLKPKLIKKNK